MGVTNFFKIINKNNRADTGGEKIAEMGDKVIMEDLEGERIAIDAPFIIYSSVLAMQFVNSLTDAQGRTTSHILAVLNKVLKMKKLGVNQLWVFDSPHSNPMKAAELKKRADRRKKSNNDKVLFQMTSEHVEDIQQLLSLMGIFYIVAPKGVEGEQYGAILTMGDEPYCKYMLSGDSDVLMFGGNMLRPVSKKQSEDGKPYFMAYNCQYIQDEMALTRAKMVKMGIALGTDFAEKTPGLGPASVHAKARYDKINLTPEQELAYNYFMDDIEMGEADLVENEYNREELLSYLEQRGFKRERYEKRINEVFGKE